jgi:trigger factor
MAVDSIDLRVEVEKPGAWSRRLTITVPAARIARERASALNRLSQRVRLPGFRKGKVPPAVLERRFGQAIEQETIERVIGEAYREAVQREGLVPITQGAVEHVDYQAGADLVFHVDFEVRPEVELQRLGGFRVKREPVPITDEQVDRVLERLREQHTVWRPIDDENPVNGDMVSVEITRRNADTAAGTKPRTYQLVLGEGQALPPVEEVIRSLRPGLEHDFTVDLPEKADDPASPLRRHEIHVRMLEAKRAERPPLDDEFARGVGDFGTLAELVDRVRSDLAQEAEREAERGVRNRLIQQILEANRFDVPDAMVRDYLEKLLPESERVEREKLEEFRASAWPAAVEMIRRHLVIERVAELESLHATPDEVDARIERVAGAIGKSPAQVRAQFEKSGRLREIEVEITEEKVFEYLKSLSTIE